MKKDVPLVMIEWEDSRQSRPAWEHLESFEPSDLCICFTVGYLINDGKRNKAIAQSIADSGINLQISGITHIPTRSIVRITPLSP